VGQAVVLIWRHLWINYNSIEAVILCIGTERLPVSDFLSRLDGFSVQYFACNDKVFIISSQFHSLQALNASDELPMLCRAI
jgi:hypothetical protein